jgi:hypothetical protein
MPEVSIFEILQRLKLLEVKVADIVRNGGSPIKDALLPPDPDSENDDCRLPATAVAARYGVVPRSIDRWLNRPELDFPPPDNVNGRRYWWLSQLRNWDRSRALKAATKTLGPERSKVSPAGHQQDAALNRHRPGANDHSEKPKAG